MKAIHHLRVLAVFLLLALWGCTPAAPSLRELTFEPLEFQVPEIARQVQDNGLNLYLQEDHELPLVEITAMVGVGSIAEPVDKTGLASLYASLLRAGGAGALGPDELDQALDQMAADFSAGADTYAVTLNLSLQAADLEQGLQILADVLRRPRFDPDRLEILRRQMIEGIRRQNDDPGAIAQRALGRALYGDHPLGRTPTIASVQAIARDDLLALHERFVHPNNLWLGITGDFDRGALQGLLERHFADWSQAAFTPQTVPPLEATPEPAAWIAPKDIPQTTILLGEVGIDKDNPDQYALRVMNFILGGGGFNSRLVREIRSNRGLSYSVYSYYQIGRRLPGPFIAGCETRSDATLEVVGLMRSIMEAMRAEPVSPDDLALAKESLINSFVFTFDDKHDVVAMTMRLDYYDYPADYLTRYREQVAAVTADDVLRVARQYLHPERQALILVGDRQSFADGLNQLALPVKDFPLEE